jgi:hypothetical protein
MNPVEPTISPIVVSIVLPVVMAVDQWSIVSGLTPPSPNNDRVTTTGNTRVTTTGDVRIVILPP